MAGTTGLSLLCCLCYVFSTVYTASAPSKEFVFAMKYLKEFHYLSPLRSGNHDWKTAIELFQRYMHLPVTGSLDKKTIEQMHKPRCGFPDIEEEEDTKSPTGRKKRFAVSPVSWNKTSLTYVFLNYGTDLSNVAQEFIIAKAFKIWSDRSVLTFTLTADVQRADIKIAFGTKQHSSCIYPFDGKGGVLGHAFYPNDGDLHFDDDEDFTDGVYTGTNLLSVAVHEIGHVLGIGHSSETNSVMNPSYTGYDPILRLHADDINAVAYLYGGGTVRPDTTPAPCADQLADCSRYQHYCDIDAYSGSMKKNCPATCGVCSQGGQVVDPKCVNKFPTSRCTSFKTAGYCVHSNIQYYCYKTCLC